MVLPHFLCIGAQKAGTSWLFAQLRSHPEVWMPPLKELHYFDHLFVPDNRKWTRWHFIHSVNMAMKHHAANTPRIDFDYFRYLLRFCDEPMFTEEWYKHAFDRQAAAGKVIGEITPEYCTIGAAGIRYVRRLLGPVRIIYIIRDPVDRALSQLRMNAERLGTPPTEEKWLELAADPVIKQRGAYSVYVPQWRAAFPEAQLLFMPFKKIAESPLPLLEELERFLGIGKNKYPAANQQIHRTGDKDIPASVIRYFNNELAPEREFIKSARGVDFAKMT